MGRDTSKEKLAGKRRPAPVSSKPRTSKAAASKKSKRKGRPPRSVRLAQSRPVDTKLRRDGFGVSVTLQVPRVKLHPKVASKLRYLRLPDSVIARLPVFLTMPSRARRLIGFTAFLTVGFLVVFSLQAFHAKTPVDTGKVAAAERTAPDFKPLIPSAAESSSTTYDGKRNMVGYSTTFSGARLTVSQQHLPARFTQDPKALTSAADSINAKQRIDTAKGPLYIATNETNDQLAIFAGPQVLLFIHSDRKLDDASWKAFIELLKVKS